MAALMMMSDVLGGQSSTEKLCPWPSSLPFSGSMSFPSLPFFVPAWKMDFNKLNSMGFIPLFLGSHQSMGGIRGMQRAKGLRNKGESSPCSLWLICLSQAPPSSFLFLQTLLSPSAFLLQLEPLSTMFSSLNFPHRVTWFFLRSLY